MIPNIHISSIEARLSRQANLETAMVPCASGPRCKLWLVVQVLVDYKLLCLSVQIAFLVASNIRKMCQD